MTTSKSASKSKKKPSRAKIVKAAPAKKAVKKSVAKSADAPSAKDVIVAAADSLKKKIKLVRDSFTIPKNEYLTLSDLKLRSARLGRQAKKSEVLRAGIEALSKMSDAVFSAALDAIPSLKTGRPKDSKKADTKKTGGKKTDIKKAKKKA
ncbi:MAG: hypothetical protein ACREO1_06895 [Arenimonas sp.]